MLTSVVLCSDCAWDHTVVRGSKPRRCPRCRQAHRAQVKDDLRYLGLQGLKGALSGAAVVGLITVAVGAMVSLVGCIG